MLRPLLVAFPVLATALAASALAYDSSVTQSCRADYFAHCSQHSLGSESLRACMRNVGPNLQPACINALVQAGEVPGVKAAPQTAKASTDAKKVPPQKLVAKTKSEAATKKAMVAKQGQGQQTKSAKVAKVELAAPSKQIAKSNKGAPAGPATVKAKLDPAKKQLAKLKVGTSAKAVTAAKQVAGKIKQGPALKQLAKLKPSDNLKKDAALKRAAKQDKAAPKITKASAD